MTGKSGKNQGNTQYETQGSGTTTPPRVVLPPTPAGAGSVDRKVQDLFRSAFRGPVPDNPLAMIEKLNQMVTSKQVEGRTVFEFSTRPFTGAPSALGGMSVAQASLYGGAQVALAEAEKRLGELKPGQLKPGDPDEVEALRAVTLIEYQRLVKELGRGGGPRENRVDLFFQELLGTTDPDAELDEKSLIGRLAALVDKQTITTADHESKVNFRLVKGSLFTSLRAWDDFKEEIVKDFSELAGQFSRKLKVIQQDVADLEDVFDQAGIDVTDREGFIITDEPEAAGSAPPEITLDGLLSWVREFAAEEGPQLTDAGGGIGIASTEGTLSKLAELITGLRTNSALPELVTSSSPLTSLETNLGDAATLAHTIATTIAGSSGGPKQG